MGSAVRFLVSGAAVGVLSWLVFFRPAGEAWTDSGASMGTFYTVRVSECGAKCDNLKPEIQQALKALNLALSHYDSESELTTFNRAPGDTWVPVSDHLYNVVAYARVISRQYGGTFDVTLAPVVDLWGFGPGERAATPDAESIRREMRKVGYTNIDIDHAAKALRKLNPETTLNLSAIAKGYAVDQIAMLLRARGISDYLVEIGGEVRAAGKAPRGNPWRVGIEVPGSGATAEFTIALDNAAIATSGDYRNFFMLDGKRYSHTIDPRSGWPVEHALASVTVITRSAAEADALATVFMVLGPERGFEYAEQAGQAALFYVRNEDRLSALYTSAFARYLPRS